jgi:hypothetical protein
MTTTCQAKDKDSCRYHGTRASSHTRMLRDKLRIAREVYKVSSTKNERIEATYYLKDAEIEYYSTDEGRAKLSEHITASTNEKKRDYLTSILVSADQKREFMELQTHAPQLQTS